jgi:chorismate synthase
MSNSFGKLFKVSTFGESHGPAIGGVIDGCPPGIALDFEAIQNELNRRKPGQSKIVTQRKEPDEVTFLSGIFEGKTTGASIGFVTPTKSQKTIPILPLLFVRRTPITPTTKNTKATEITEEVDVLPQEKRRIG